MTHSDQIPLLWSQVIARYEKITKKKLDDPALRGLTTVDGLLEAIDNENKVFGDFREKKHGIFAALKLAMLPIELVGDLAAGGASMAFPPSSLVFGAVKFLLNAAHGVSAKYDAIMGLMATLKDFTIRLEVYAQQQISDSLSNKLADILTTLLEVFALSRQQIKQGRLLSFGKNVLLGNDEGKAAMAKLANLIDSERGLVGAETLTEVKVANVTLTRVDYNVLELTRRVEDMTLAQDQVMAQVQDAKDKGHRDHVKKVLEPGTSAEDKYSMINRSRVPHTGDWMREEKDFRDWMGKEKPILWVSGTPGAGKSYIASNIISLLKESYPQNVQHPSHVSVGYFFFKDDNPKTRSFHQALRDIAFKVAQNDPVYAKHVISCVDEPEDIATLQSLWQRLFLDFFIEDERADSSLYIVLDGMDESNPEDREEFFELVKDIQEGGRFQLLMLGRPHIGEEMEEVMETFKVATIYVSDLNNSEDIVRYIKSSIQRSVYLKRASKGLQADIVSQLSRGAQGMFIWVDFMLKELLKKKNEASMRKALNAAPTGLARMIRHVLKAFSESLKDSPEYADDLNEMLAWVTCAQRPLKLVELDNMLKWRYPEGDGWIWLEGSLRRQFASFFLLTRQDRLNTADLQRAAVLGGGFDVDEPLFDSEDGYDDVDNPSDFNSDPLTTDVTFNHASLGDFFRNEKEGKVSAEEGCPPIGVNYHQAQVLVLRRYFEVIACEDDAPNIAIARILRPYACPSLIPALRGIDIAKSSKEEKQEIGLYLARLLSKESIVKNFAGTMTYSFYCKDNLDLLHKWLSDPDVQESLPSEEKSWYEKATSENKADILARFIRFVASQWLENLMWRPFVCCTMIFNFLNLRNGGTTVDLQSPSQALEAAEWCGLEKTALWYRRLAMAHRELKYNDEALECFQKALELDPTQSLARAGMALTYLAKKDIPKTIELDRITVQEMEETSPEDRPTYFGDNIHTVYERLGDCYEELDDMATSHAMYLKGYEYNNRCDDCICAILDYLHDEKKFEESIALLRGMDEKIPDKEYTRLTESLFANSWLYDAYIDLFSAAAYHTGNLDFLLRAYSTAATAARRERKAVQAANLELCLGVLYCVYGNDPDRAARIWERLINTYRGSKAEGDIARVLEATSAQLATHCLIQIAELGHSSHESQKYGHTLELLARGKPLNFSNFSQSDMDSDIATGKGFVTPASMGLFLANFYKLTGREEDAMACFKAQVQDCIRLLSDDDPSNDGEAYYRLASVLAAIGDDETAAGMWYQQYMLATGDEDDDEDEKDEDEKDEDTEKEEQSTDESQDESKDQEGYLYTCNGCSHFFCIDGLSVCRYCDDIQFCSTCIELLKSGTLPVNACSQKHDWMAIPPRPQAVRERTKEHKEMIFMKGEWISIEAMKQQLREKWGIQG